MTWQNLKKSFEKALKTDLAKRTGPPTLLKACRYSLFSKGKRVRPLIVLLIAEALGTLDVMPAALAMEFFHTASLIADDLPAMDDQKERRDIPTLHCAFNEPIALLASYALIGWGYEMIVKNGRIFQKERKNSDNVVFLALEEATQCGGANGVVGGQCNDMYPEEPSLETLLTIMRQKTAAFFEGAFALGWLFGGGVVERLAEVKQCAQYIGIAFQIADDIKDMAEDHDKLNIAQLIGVEKAKQMLRDYADRSKKALKNLSLITPAFQKAIRLIIP
ncbi:MAG: polyprenyl synthetase family protein [Parachlamydiales bacterium]|nr:polyprenyl synthetase family protein [Parachlamydiales bacterium]